jgi:hypothetical protein
MDVTTFRRVLLSLFVLLVAETTQELFMRRISAQASPPIVVPKAWSTHELADWATPLVGLGARPGFYSEEEFNEIPTQVLYRTYPAYHPDREPAGYWEWLQKQEPKPLLDASTLHTKQDWLNAGQVVFRELHQPLPPQANQSLRDLIPLVRSRDALARARIKPLPDGTLPLLWVVTPDGVFPAAKSCQSCHRRYMPDGTIIDGAAANHQTGGLVRLINSIQGPFGQYSQAGIEVIRNEGYRREGVPWLKDDVHAMLKSMTRADLEEYFSVEERTDSQIMPRGGSGLFPTKVLDLNGVRDRTYLNHTATHVNRGVADIMRYAWTVECCDAGRFGSYQLRSGMPRSRPSDEVVFALATYIYSLEAPPSPFRNNPLAADGKKIFDREGCAACHTPPLYTNNKLTLAKGFAPPADHPYRGDIMPVSVGTDPGRAMQTRVGTGLYKVPSLKGVWYRNLFGHSGDVASLEDWFDAARLRDDYVPSGWKGFKQKQRAVPGHEFGLKLPTPEKTALIAFLRTL